MSILVHPDKNQDDAERAQQAFESKWHFDFNQFTDCPLITDYEEINYEFISIV